MKEIKLSRGLFAQVDDDDFEYLNQFKWYAQKCGNGRFYAARHLKKEDGAKVVLMHRVIMGLRHGDKRCIDHINLNELCNTKSNLRICNKSENGANSKKIQNKTSIYKGVFIYKNTRFNKTENKITTKEYWCAGLKINYKRIHLGYFKTELEAAMAYNKRATELFGEFANLNQI